ncbi:MAG: Zn-ribbon domain-containing OB-fold protein [Actinomycetota bacterium]
MTHTLNELVMGTAPTVIDETRGFWEATMREELVIQRCSSCNAVQHPGGPCCSTCLSQSLEWVRASGRGSVFSFTVVRHAFHPSFMDKLPYVLADVQLQEGPIMTAGLTDCDPEQVRIDMPVSVYFTEPLEDAFHVPLRLPKFKPA